MAESCCYDPARCQHAPGGADMHYHPQVVATQAGLILRTVSAVNALMLLSPATRAVTLEGHVTFPGRAIPAATVYAHNIDNAQLHRASLRRNEVTFSLDLPAGRYWVFVQPREPGLTELYGAYTRYSLCRRQSSHLVEGCNDHGLQEIEVTASKRSGIEIDDWFLDDAAAAALDRILGTAPAAPDQAELGRPRFSEYRASPPAALMTNPKLALPAGSKAAPFARELGEAANRGVNFAASFALARLGCGEGCAQVALVDLTNGSVLLPEALAQVSSELPCREQDVLDYRDDSRLLEFTRREEDAVVTDYLVWDNARRNFTLLAQYRRNVERYCASPSETEKAAE